MNCFRRIYGKGESRGSLEIEDYTPTSQELNDLYLYEAANRFHGLQSNDLAKEFKIKQDDKSIEMSIVLTKKGSLKFLQNLILEE